MKERGGEGRGGGERRGEGQDRSGWGGMKIGCNGDKRPGHNGMG